MTRAWQRGGELQVIERQQRIKTLDYELENWSVFSCWSGKELVSSSILVDASGAGEGNLEISVNHSGRNIPNQVNPIGNSRFEVQFTPQEATVHYCNILFNGELVPGKYTSNQRTQR